LNQPSQPLATPYFFNGIAPIPAIPGPSSRMTPNGRSPG
jgi:hypothetical protein